MRPTISHLKSLLQRSGYERATAPSFSRIHHDPEFRLLDLWDQLDVTKRQAYPFHLASRLAHLEKQGAPESIMACLYSQLDEPDRILRTSREPAETRKDDSEVSGGDAGAEWDRKTLERHTAVRFPAQCVIGQPAVLTVQLTVRPKDPELYTSEQARLQPPRAMSIEPTHSELERQVVNLIVMVSADNFQVDSRWRTLVVPLETDSEVVQFVLTAVRPGSRLIEIEFFHSTARIGYVVVNTEVVDRKIVSHG